MSYEELMKEVRRQQLDELDALAQEVVDDDKEEFEKNALVNDTESAEEDSEDEEVEDEDNEESTEEIEEDSDSDSDDLESDEEE